MPVVFHELSSTRCTPRYKRGPVGAGPKKITFEDDGWELSYGGQFAPDMGRGVRRFFRVTRLSRRGITISPARTQKKLVRVPAEIHLTTARDGTTLPSLAKPYTYYTGGIILPGAWCVTRFGKNKTPITRAATLAMLEGISREPDRLTREMDRCDGGAAAGGPIPPSYGINAVELRTVLEAVEIPAPLWDSLCEEFQDLL